MDPATVITLEEHLVHAW